MTTAQAITSPIRIPVVPELERGAYDRRGAAAYLSISTTTLWRLTASGKIRKTSVGVYPKTELDRWLKKEIA